MKLHVALALLLSSFTLCTVLSQENLSWENVRNFDKQLNKFYQLLKSKGGPDLQIENLRDAIGKALKKGSECLRESVKDFGNQLNKFNKDFSSIVYGTGENSDVDQKLKIALVEFGMQFASPRRGPSQIQRLVDIVNSMEKIADLSNNAELQKDVEDVKQQVITGLNVAYHCVKEELKKELHDEKFVKVLAIWKESGSNE